MKKNKSAIELMRKTKAYKGGWGRTALASLGRGPLTNMEMELKAMVGSVGKSLPAFQLGRLEKCIHVIGHYAKEEERKLRPERYKQWLKENPVSGLQPSDSQLTKIAEEWTREDEAGSL